MKSLDIKEYQNQFIFCYLEKAFIVKRSVILTDNDKTSICTRHNHYKVIFMKFLA